MPRGGGIGENFWYQRVSLAEADFLDTVIQPEARGINAALIKISAKQLGDKEMI